jgi:hypothetical protein
VVAFSDKNEDEDMFLVLLLEVFGEGMDERRDGFGRDRVTDELGSWVMVLFEPMSFCLGASIEGLKNDNSLCTPGTVTIKYLSDMYARAPR